MRFRKKSKILLDAINNEYAIDAYTMKHLFGRDDLSFTPIKAIVLLKYIDRFHINLFLYSILSFLFFLLCPFYFLYKFSSNLIRHYKFNKPNYLSTNNTIVLKANSRIVPLTKDILKDKSHIVLNINQPALSKEECHIYSFLSFKNFIKIYIETLILVFMLVWQLERKTDILRAYIVYDLLLVAEGLEKTILSPDKLYFSNHYDRWATLFDQLFESEYIILIQHGLLPKDLVLPYPLQNLREIYAMDQESEDIFLNLFNLNNVSFKRLDIGLELVEVDHEFSILIIGQPHVEMREVMLVKSIIDRLPFCTIYIKPHPVFSHGTYLNQFKNSNNVIIIGNKTFFPKTDVALNYESTLGVEYEQSGVPVINWKGIDVELVMNQLGYYLNKKRYLL